MNIFIPVRFYIENEFKMIFFMNFSFFSREPIAHEWVYNNTSITASNRYRARKYYVNLFNNRYSDLAFDSCTAGATAGESFYKIQRGYVSQSI